MGVLGGEGGWRFLEIWGFWGGRGVAGFFWSFCVPGEILGFWRVLGGFEGFCRILEIQRFWSFFLNRVFFNGIFFNGIFLMGFF